MRGVRQRRRPLADDGPLPIAESREPRGFVAAIAESSSSHLIATGQYCAVANGCAPETLVRSQSRLRAVTDIWMVAGAALEARSALAALREAAFAVWDEPAKFLRSSRALWSGPVMAPRWPWIEPGASLPRQILSGVAHTPKLCKSRSGQSVDTHIWRSTSARFKGSTEVLMTSTDVWPSIFADS
jgi:hypothetical protein